MDDRYNWRLENITVYEKPKVILYDKHGQKDPLVLFNQKKRVNLNE
jgi:hypothetical protein